MKKILTLKISQNSGANDNPNYMYYSLVSTMTGFVISNTLGNVDNAYYYNPYGELQFGTVGSSFGYEGQYIGDQNQYSTTSNPLYSGLVYMKNRYYDPATGVFVSQDPLINQTNQAYVYSNDNPVGNWDPSGKFSIGHLFNPCDWGNVCHHLHNKVDQYFNDYEKASASTAEFYWYANYYILFQVGRVSDVISNRLSNLPTWMYVVIPGLTFTTAESQLFGCLLSTGELFYLSGDATIDSWETNTLHKAGEHGPGDEHTTGHILPGNQGPVWLLPGIHTNGKVDISGGCGCG